MNGRMVGRGEHVSYIETHSTPSTRLRERDDATRRGAAEETPNIVSVRPSG